MRSLTLGTVLVIAVALVPRLSRADEAAPLARKACEAALAAEQAGRPTVSSRGPCHQAMLLGGLVEDMRNEVASMMSPVAHPSLDDLVVASLIADAAVRKNNSLPWGFMARCDIARKMGSADVMESCLADLRRVAPDSPLTLQAMNYPAEHGHWWVSILRLLLAVVLVGTLAHALWWRSKQRARRPAPVSTAAPLVNGLLLVIGAWLAMGGVAQAMPTAKKDHLSSFEIDDADPEAGVPDEDEQNHRPLQFGYFIQDLEAKAERAGKAGDHAAEARYYRALTKATPQAAYGPRKLCEALQASGDSPNAIIACRTVITRNGSNAGDYVHFVALVLRTPGPLPPDERKELDNVLQHLSKEAQLGAVPTMLQCEVDLRFDDVAALETCTKQLDKLAPNDPKTVSLKWAVALHKQDRSAARALIDRARGIGMNGDGIAKMEQATRAMTMRWVGRMVVVVTGAAACLFLLVFAFRRGAERRRVAA